MEPGTIDHLLTEWGLEKLIPIFHEHCIDIDILKTLNKQNIKELIPQIGLRLKLEQKLSNFISSNDDNIIIEYVDMEAEETASTALTSNSTSNSSTSVSEFIKTVNVFPDGDVGLPETLRNKTPHNLYKAECAKKTGLEELLKKTIKGKVILSAYQNNNNKMTSEYRNKLVELIIESELNEDVNSKISVNRFEELAEAISHIFKTEFKEVYFMKTKFSKNGRTRFIGRGKLFCKYYNYRKQLRLAGLLAATSRETEDEDVEEAVEYDEEVNSRIEWLKHNKEPLQKVEENWHITFTQRKTLLKKLNIHEYYQLFPILTSSSGYLLFNIDYELLYPGKDNFYGNWSSFSKKILDFAKTKGSDRRIKTLLLDINSSKSEESRTTKILCLLPYLVSPVAISKQLKPSKSEIAEAFIMHVKVIQNLHSAIQSRDNKLRSQKLCFQPTPIIVGADLDTIVASYVKVNETLYEVETPLKAVEVAFKAIHALNALYQTEAEQVWLIVQKALFNVSTPFDKQFVSVNTLLCSLE